MILPQKSLMKRVLSILLSAVFILLSGENQNLPTTAAGFCDSVSEIPKIECEALIALYNSTDGANWTNNTNWLVTNTPSNWYGVVDIAYYGNVNWLNLRDNQLSGIIPPELGNLTKLHRLDLQHNQLNGSLPPELGNMTKIWDLWLSNNQLSGSIPPELGNLSNLRALNLQHNQLSDSIPPELGNLTNLKLLDLDRNQLSGSIPPELMKLSNLMRLRLDNNQLSGSIPPELEKLSNLKWLRLDNNQLNGRIPPELGNLPYLISLMINDNQLLFGPLPISLTNLIKLDTFMFSDTKLCERTEPSFQVWLSGISNLHSTGKKCSTILLSPNDLIDDSTPTFKWNRVPTATRYRLSVYSVTTSSYVFSLPVTASSACFGGVCKYTSPTPLPQGGYRFKVRAKNADGWGPVSIWMYFKLGTPQRPVWIGPNGNILDTTPRYKWYETNGARRYKLMVYSIDSSSNVLNVGNLHYSGICSGGICSYTPAAPLSTGDYQFKVRAWNKFGWGPVSAWMSFTVSP
jgi:Leucine-rich repeat (LRR) protein